MLGLCYGLAVRATQGGYTSIDWNIAYCGNFVYYTRQEAFRSYNRLGESHTYYKLLDACPLRMSK